MNITKCLIWQDCAMENDARLLNSFEALLGRQATDKERIHLLRAKNALGLRDNDALWMILMTLEEYAYRYDQIPEKIQKDTAILIEEHKKHLETEAIRAAEKAQSKIVDALVQQVKTNMDQSIETKYFLSLGWSAIALVFLAVTTFVAGFVMGSGRLPWWTRSLSDLSIFEIFFSTILAAPAGWIFSLLAMGCTGFYIYHNLLGNTIEELRGKTAIILKSICYIAVTLFLLYMTFIS